ncbi:dihydrolipoyl dehydrogenase [uncultured Fretibacterium sp.]|uniref:dihydrolipoyl dehydrogenase n=1 Tax=uncultured Fretibacterium sp. TaxID=1678694 RepID=UPI002614B3F1|nr:dihydrolipoyl dehydrogenase [uncultured Fretibacterium sp.]
MSSKRIVIIGAGPGGYVAAIHAEHLGASVTLIEKKTIGGTCLNVGCIPTKVLLHTAELLTELKSEAKRIGVLVEGTRLDWDALMKRKTLTVSRLVKGTLNLVQGNGIEYIEGVAAIKDPHTVEVNGRAIQADAIVIATGSVPDVPDVPGYDLEGVITSDEALSLPAPPASMVVSGGGIIGMEFAAAYAAFGTKVTVAVTSPEILRNLDTDIALILRKTLEKRGVSFRTGASITRVTRSGEGLKIELTTPEGQVELEAEKLLVAKGRKPYTEGLGLDALGIEMKRGRIVTDAHMETNVKGIYAIGDCVNAYMLAHVASREGEVAVENIMGHAVDMDYTTTPGAIYTSPEIATVGLSEKDAAKRGLKVKVGSFPLMLNGKSMITGDTSGVIKIIADDETHQILGVEMVGGPATDMIAEGALALHFKATPDDLLNTIHAHPTVAEAVAEAAGNVFARGIHTPKG